MKVEYVNTSDNLRLMGVHYPGRDTCLIEVHGMSGNFIENYYANILGQRLSESGYGFIYGHSRGYCHVNDIATSSVRDTDNGWEKVRIGEAYELFEDSPKDVAAWVARAHELGYAKVVLLGHSLGCNKVIYYLHSNPDADIAGLVLLSPPDIAGLVELERYQPNHQKLLAQARKFVAEGEPLRVLDGKIWDWYELSAQTYLSLFEAGRPADNLPVLRNPVVFEQLASVQQPILAVMGEHDDIEIRDLHNDIELIKSKATACQDFQIRFVEGANHDYENREDQLATEVLGWLEKM